MHPVTVAIADPDPDRRKKYERSLRGELGSSLLTNVVSSSEASNDAVFKTHRSKPRTSATASEDEVLRITRLKPRVLLINMNLFSDEDCAMLLSMRRECPETLMVLLTGDSVQENMILQALEIGVRGYLNPETMRSHLLKAIQVIDRGEAWVPRKMLDKIMDRVMH